MLQIKNTLGGGKPEGLYAWTKNEIGSEAKEANERISQLPFQFSGGSSVVLNGEIHILGTSYGSNNRQHYKWNGSSWTNASTLPYKFYYGAAVILNGEIHIFGGTGSSYNKNHYKWNGKSWVSVSTLPYDFYLGSAVVFNGEIHILGGSNGYGTSHYKWNGSSWINASTLPYDFSGGSAIVFNNEIHILGSYPRDYRRAHYKWDGSTWSSASTIPYDFYYCSAVVFDDALHVIGGVPSEYHRNHYKFDGSSWISVGTLPYPFYQGCAVVFDNAIHILGSTANTTEYYMNHYLIMHYVTVYTFLDYIVSDKETAYPDGGEKGGYWYEKVVDGAQIAEGSKSGSNANPYNNPTIEHGLGAIPTNIIIYYKDKGYQTAGYANYKNGASEGYYANANNAKTGSVTISDVTETSFKLSGGNRYSSDGLGLHWIAIVE